MSFRLILILTGVAAAAIAAYSLIGKNDATSIPSMPEVSIKKISPPQVQGQQQNTPAVNSARPAAPDTPPEPPGTFPLINAPDESCSPKKSEPCGADQKNKPPENPLLFQ
ncbi:MAG: hypothetical protein HY401_01740 [Elusimicrobia bacterium]|nr:hypothetical protein [Elusimicrobiota bacterium]